MMMLSPNLLHVDDSSRFGKSRLDSGLTFSKSTPDLNSEMATQAEINAKVSEKVYEAQKEKAVLLMKKRESLQLKLKEKLLELRNACLDEAQITGKLPVEFPDIPGQPPPVISKRMVTEFALSSKFLEKNIIRTNDAIERLELEIEIQQQKTDALRKLSEDKSVSKSARRHHRLEYLSQSERMKQLKETLNIYLEERGRGKITFSKTTDDVGLKSNWKGDGSDETCYRTLPNPHKRRPVTPQTSNSSTTESTPSPYKSQQMRSDSLIDGSSISSNSSSLIGSGLGRQVAHHPDPSYVGSRGYAHPANGAYLNVHHGVYPRWKGSSVSPSSVESSDLASSCSSSLSSLQLNSGADSGNYNPYHDNQSPNSHFDSPGEYSSYLRNMQKTYFAPSGKYACGSLDRKKLVKKNSSKVSNPGGAATQIVELAELLPSKFGSKRESAVDSNDSPYNFEEAVETEELSDRCQTGYPTRNHEFLGSSYAPSFGRLQESSSESSGIHSATEDRKSDCYYKSISGKNNPLRFQPVQSSASFKTPDSRNWSKFTEVPSEMLDINEYTESLRNMQQRHQELRGARAGPSPDPRIWLEQMNQRKRDKNPAGQRSRTQGRKSLTTSDTNGDAVDALFQHNNQQSHVNAFEYCRRNSNDVGADQPQRSGLSSNYARLNSSSSSSLSSYSSSNSAPQPLQFIKVTPNNLTPAVQEKVSTSSLSSFSHTPSAFEINGRSTLV